MNAIAFETSRDKFILKDAHGKILIIFVKLNDNDLFENLSLN
jgi:hypothetical protein